MTHTLLSDSNTDSHTHTHTDTPACDALTARYRHMTHTAAAAGRRDTHRAPHVSHSVIQPTRVVVAF